jgi:hypothetical protein
MNSVSIPSPVKKVTVTIPGDILDRIAAVSSNRSGFLAAAARHELDRISENGEKMHDNTIMYDCDFCSQKFQMGPHIYNGKYIKTYKILVCKSCYGSNWDGWSPHHESILLKHIEKHGLIIPKRNDEGYLPRD